MIRIALPVTALGMTLLAVAVSRHSTEPPNETAGRQGVEGWVPSRLTNEKQAKAEIEAVLDEVHAAYRTGDEAAAAAHIEFPVLMITDDWKGEVNARYWDRATWMRAMAPLFEHPAHELRRAHHHNIVLISDSLASVDDEQSVILGRKKVTVRSSSLVIRKDRRWFVKTTVEGGWGDTPLAKACDPAVDERRTANDATPAPPCEG